MFPLYSSWHWLVGELGPVDCVCAVRVETLVARAVCVCIDVCKLRAVLW